MKTFVRLAGCLVLAAALAGCEDEVKDTCGNGAVEAWESCDGSDLGGATCQTLGYTTGALSCSATCRFVVDACEGLVSCGNGVIDDGEQCDGSDLAGATCESRSQGSGALSCDPVTCQLDTAGCSGASICGDGVADGDEVCDGVDFRGATCSTLDASWIGGSLDCSAQCTIRTTGCFAGSEWPIGAPCETQDQCPGGRCYTEVGDRFAGAPGGACVERCAEDGSCPLSGDAGVCVDSGYFGFCFARCDLQNPQCRAGYHCLLVGDKGVCYPSCTDDAQCEITNQCDLDSGTEMEGFCITPEEVCGSGTDEDFDGLVDCSDPDCIEDAACAVGEDCFAAGDEDGDGVADCEDGECAFLGACSGLVCTAAGPALGCGTTLTGQANDATGATNVISRYTCLDPSTGEDDSVGQRSAMEFGYALTVDATQVVTVALTGMSDNLDILVIKQTLGEFCDPGYGCFTSARSSSTGSETVTFSAYPEVTYYVVVDARMGVRSDFDLAVTCEATGFEDCGNGADDDGDGLVDCADPECLNVPPSCGNP